MKEMLGWAGEGSEKRSRSGMNFTTVFFFIATRHHGAAGVVGCKVVAGPRNVNYVSGGEVPREGWQPEEEDAYLAVARSR